MSRIYPEFVRKEAIIFLVLMILSFQSLGRLSASPSKLLEVNISLDKEAYSPGDQFTFTIRISNQGDEWIDIHYGKVHIRHSNLGWLFGEFTTEEFDVDLSLEPRETKEKSITKTIPAQIPAWLNIFGDWEFTLVLTDDEGDEYTSNTLKVKFR